MKIEVIRVDYKNKRHAEDLVTLLSLYATDPMGGGKDLSDKVKQHLAAQLAEFPTAFSILAYVNDKPAGLVNCFESFSTFACRPLVNIHDIIVSTEFRGLGLSQKMLKKVEQLALEKGCCKLTLEVLEGNNVAQNAYLKFGFRSYRLDPAMGNTLFWQKNLNADRAHDP